MSRSQPQHINRPPVVQHDRPPSSRPSSDSSFPSLLFMDTHTDEIPARSTTPVTSLSIEHTRSLQETPRSGMGSGSVMSTTEKNSTVETLLEAEMKGNLSMDAPQFFEEIFLTKEISDEMVQECFNCIIAEGLYSEAKQCFPNIPQQGLEKPMYAPTRDVMNAIIKWRHSKTELPPISTTAWYVATKGLVGATLGHQAVYPDLIDRATGETDIEGAEDGRLSWLDVRLICEVKPKDDKDTDISLHLQLAKYARKVFLYQGGRRRFVLGWTLCGSTVRGWLFDRSGGLSSEPYDFHREPHKFIRMILAIATLSPEDLGFDPTISVEIIDGQRFNVVEFDDGDPTSKHNGKYVIVKTLMPRPSLCGRGTFVWEVYKMGDPSNRRAIKDAWRDSKRKLSEGEIFQRIKKLLNGAKLEGVVDCLSFYDLQSPRRQSQSSFDDIQVSVRRGVQGNLGDRFAKRRHCRLLMAEAGTPLGEFKSLKELFGVLIDGVKGHQRLHDNMRILHRDISFGNILMSRKADPHTGHRRGFLIDLDFAKFLDDNDDENTVTHHKSPVEQHISPAMQRLSLNRQINTNTNTIDEVTQVAPITGTLPFIAIDVLRRGARHSHVHDLESFFWLLVWTCTVYDGAGNRVDLKRLHKKDDRRLMLKKLVKQDTYSEAADSKTGWLQNYLGDIRRYKDPAYGCHFFAIYFIPVLDCLSKLGALMQDGRDPVQEGPDVRTYSRVLWVLEQTYARLPSEDPAPDPLSLPKVIILKPYVQDSLDPRPTNQSEKGEPDAPITTHRERRSATRPSRSDR
ncbi:hypothetical protein SISSUDRAFT_1052851 [Sistotremastrum suecicum HHB10207 ss-3]|uniref:Protein kinase domain-containing protein n=1 Tax=Sistotremastrum suecicum HHB10207 ss-3 TaxID=1314776 RepID=A0A165ZL13_9AGAM|nr:hypothetical protein SISSUDRAFT_1052851 [Sistotremastrum suecicum HHB10207 ss-3]